MADNIDRVSQEIKDAIDRKDKHQLRIILQRTSTCPEKAILWAMKGEVNLDKETLSLMKEKGANVKAVSNSQTALVCACWWGFLECAQLLLDYGADVNVRDNVSRTPLWSAVKSRSSEIVQVLIENGADVIAKDISGKTALMFACNRNFIKGAQLLVDNGVDVNYRDNDGETALMFACRSRSLNCFKLLTDHGADVSAKNESSRNALMYACDNDFIKGAQLLIDSGVGVNDRDNDRGTALMYPCQSKSRECAKLLTDHGADINPRNNDGETALMYACRSRSLNCLKLLIDHGADVSAENETGVNALKHACHSDFIKGAQLLIDNGVDVNDRDNDGDTALMYACKSNSVKCVKLLIDHGADVNVRSYRGWTPLEHACRSGYLDCVKCLTDHGADIHATDADNTVLSQIHKFTPSHRKIYSLLIRLGAKDDDYKHLMSLNSEATADKKHEAMMKLNEMKTKWKINLKSQARWSVYQTSLSNKRTFRNIIETLIKDGHIPQKLEAFMLFEDSGDKQEMAAILRELYTSHEVQRKLREYRRMRREKPELNYSFVNNEMFEPHHRKLLQWIPVVKFYGMGEDGLYSIHIVDGCVNKTSAFIQSMIPGFKFHSVPWRKHESIQLLGYPGGPLHSRQCFNADEGMLENFVTHPDGTIGGFAALVGDTSKNEIYILTANHVVKPDIPEVEYITWSKDDQSDKHVIGRDVPYRIPLRMDKDDENDKEDDNDDYNKTWDDDNTADNLEAFNEEMCKECVSDLIMMDNDIDEEEEEQYDIACIKMADQDAIVDINADVKDQNKDSPEGVDEQHKNTKQQYNICSQCCTESSHSTYDLKHRSSVGSKVVKLGSSEEELRGKILKVDAAGEIKVGKDTAWVENMVAICADTSDPDTPYTQPGDSGTIVCGTKYISIGHYPYCWMIFAGWDKANDYNTSGRPLTLAFPLRDALEKLEKQVNMEEPEKEFKLCCCENVFQQTEEQ